MNSFSKIKRLDFISRSPIVYHFGESLAGLSTIRSYRVESGFIRKIKEKVDQNNQVFYPHMIVELWMRLRLEIIGNLMVLFASIFAIIAKGSISSGVAGLSISSASTVLFEILSKNYFYFKYFHKV